MTFRAKIYKLEKSFGKLLYTLATLFVVANLLLIIVCDFRMSNFAEPYTYESVNKIPYNDYGLLLGTSQYTRNGEINLYSKFRIEAAILLYRTKKIKYILVSGNKEKYYKIGRAHV